MKIIFNKRYPGFLSVRRQASGFFYSTCCILAALVFFFAMHFYAWAQSQGLDKALLPAEKEWLKQHSQWRLGVDPTWPPVEMIGDDGVYTGMGADYINLVAARLGVATEVMPGLSWVEVMDKARNGDVDVLPSLVHTFDRSAYLNFSDVYLDLPLVIITRIDRRDIDNIKDLYGKVISVIEGQTICDWLAKDHPAMILHPYRNVSYALDAVVFGQADAYVGDIASASYMIDRLNISSLQVAGTTKYSYANRIGVRKDWPELIPILNKALASVSVQERDDIKKKWIKFVYKRSLWQTVKEVIPFFIVIIVLALSAVNFFLSREIKNRRITERALRRSEQRFKDVLYSSVDLVWETDARGRCTYTSDAVTRMLGYSVEEIVGKLLLDFVAKEEFSRASSIFAGVTAAKKPLKDTELVLVANDGRRVNVLTNAVPVLDEKGTLLGYRGVHKDITGQKRAQEAISRSEELFRLLVEKSPIATIVLAGEEEKIEYVNPEFFQLFGYTYDDIHSVDDWWRLAYPDKANRDQLKAVWQERIRAGIENVPATRPLETMVCCKDGSKKTVEFAQASVGAKKIIFMMDLTARKQAEELLSDSEARFRLLIENSPDGIVILDPETARFIQFNEMACRQLGYSREEFAGLRISDFDVLETAEDVQARMEKVIREGRNDFETKHRTKQGEIRDVYVTAQAHKISGRLVYHCVWRDITDAKRAQEALRESEQRLSEVQKMAQLGYWEWDVKTGNVVWSEEVFRIFHLDPKKFTPRIDSILDLSPYPEDHARDKELIRRVTERHEKGEYEQRFLLPDKSIGYYYSTFQGHYDKEGKLASIVGSIMDITARRRAEELIRESNLKFKSLFDNMGEGVALQTVVFDKDGRAVDYVIEDVNASYERILNIKRSDAVGRLSTDVYRVDRPPYLEEYYQTVLTGEGRHLEVYFASFNKFFSIYVSPWSRNGFATIFTDITGRKKMEAEIIDSREYLDAIINAIGDPIIVTDSQGVLVLVNDAACRLMHMTREQQVGKTLYDLFPREQADTFTRGNKEILNGGQPFMVEEYITYPDGSTHTVLTKKALYVDKAGNKFVVSLTRDITYMKVVEQQEHLAQLGRLVGEMAHEVSNPLMIISGNAQLSLMEDIGNPKVKENLDIIMKESHRAKEIIQRLLKFSRPSKGAQKALDINQIVEAVSGILEHQFGLSNVTINKVLAPGLPSVMIDEQQMREVLMNLLNNARDAMPGGGTIEICTGVKQNKLIIDVKDTGSGMSEEVQLKIFEPFFTTKEKGTGLGLSICYGIIKAHNGELKVQSQVGKGTVFSIILPGG